MVGAPGPTPRPEVLLAPVRFPDADRGHRLDDLVRVHASRDRFRDVVGRRPTLLLPESWRHVGELLLAAVVALVVVFVAIAGRPLPRGLVRVR